LNAVLDALYGAFKPLDGGDGTGGIEIVQFSLSAFHSALDGAGARLRPGREAIKLVSRLFDVRRKALHVTAKVVQPLV
jgi:hypothetical protein